MFPDIQEYPTWEFPDGTRETGVLSLETLSQRTTDSEGNPLPIPQRDTPIFEEIGDQTVAIGSPLHIPVDVYDPDGGVQTVTVSVENPELLEAVVLSGNRSIRIDMETYGDMIFELFEQRAPTASGRVAELAEAGFYDGIIFHRVVNEFVIQAGDPTGTGTSGSNLPDFSDDFHPDLQHNRSGVLSFAKTGDDTNNSQFFITEVPTRHLDFNHSIFGQLVEGDDVREAISNHQTNSGGTPSQRIGIETIEVFDDIENSVVMLKARGNTTGSTNVTFTVTDPDGKTFSETIQVDVVADSGRSSNAQPFLNNVSPPDSSPINTPEQLQLSSTDVEGDAVEYFANLVSGNATVDVDATTGLLTVDPATGFTGQVQVNVGVRPGPGVTGNSPGDSDTELLSFNFEGEEVDPPASIDLLAGSDSGSSDQDNVTNLESLTFSVGGVANGANVDIILVSTGAVIGTAIASGTTATITTNNIAALGDGTYDLVARQTVSGQTSSNSSSLSITYDSQAPDSVINSATTRANLGIEYRSDLISPEEGNGLTYSITDGPNSANIDANTGLLTWTPNELELGPNTFTVAVTDLAGNTRTESFDVTVAGMPLAAIKLTITDLSGNELSSVQVGQEFLLNFIGVDTRIAFDRDGVFAAFADILFDPALVQPVAGVPIDFADDFPTLNSGTFEDGLIDELGAASDGLTASNLEESPIASVRFEAIGTGSVNFRSEPADNDISEVLLYGNDNRIEAESVEYRSVSLAIGQNFTVGDDQFTVAEDSGATTLDVLRNDDVVQGSATLSVISVTQPASGGTVALQNGAVTFTPDGNFNGTATFSYRVADTDGAQDSGSVTVTVTPVNDPPTGRADSLEVNENTSGNSLAVLVNDDDIDGDSLTITAVDSDTTGATVTVGPDGQVVLYTPPADFTGTDTFTYTVSDGTATTEVEATVTVTPADPPPTANDDAFNVNEDDPEAEFDILSNDTADENGESFVLDSVSAGEGGSARISSDGTQFFYAPAPDFFGTEEVVYTIRDTGGGIASATVTFTVAGSNDPPPVSSPTVTVNRGSGDSLVLSISDLPANVDGSGETVTFSDLGTPSGGGQFRIDDSSGSIFYTPPSGEFVGTDSVTFVVNDGTGLTSNGTLTVDVVDLVPRNILLSATGLEFLPRINGIKLTGTDALGNSVDMALTYVADGEPRFADVLPGEYSVEIPAIPFLQHAESPQSISVVSSPDDGDSTVSPTLGRLRPEYISIRDWLGSAPRRNILAAVAPGNASVLTAPSPTAAEETITDPIVALDSSGDMVTINGTSPAGSELEPLDLPAVLDGRVQTRGVAGDLRLYKISAEESDGVVFAEVSDGADPEAEFVSASSSPLTAVGEAEGELIAPAISRIDAGVLNLDDDRRVQPQQTELADEPASKATSVDTAMQDVAEQLTLISPAAEALSDPADLDDLAVDAAIGEAL